MLDTSSLRGPSSPAARSKGQSEPGDQLEAAVGRLHHLELLAPRGPRPRGLSVPGQSDAPSSPALGGSPSGRSFLSCVPDAWLVEVEAQVSGITIPALWVQAAASAILFTAVGISCLFIKMNEITILFFQMEIAHFGSRSLATSVRV